MKRRLLVQSIAFVVVAVFAVGIWASGDEVQAGWLRFFSVAVAAALGLLALWDNWLWRLSRGSAGTRRAEKPDRYVEGYADLILDRSFLR